MQTWCFFCLDRGFEQAIREDVARGQLIKGNSDWGFPAFPTKETPSYKAIKRGRRMVVDYWELNKVDRAQILPDSELGVH